MPLVSFWRATGLFLSKNAETLSASLDKAGRLRYGRPMPSIRFIKSAVLPRDYPADQGVEIAIAGRSNAGISSLINLLSG